MTLVGLAWLLTIEMRTSPLSVVKVAETDTPRPLVKAGVPVKSNVIVLALAGGAAKPSVSSPVRRSRSLFIARSTTFMPGHQGPVGGDLPHRDAQHASCHHRHCCNLFSYKLITLYVISRTLPDLGRLGQ